MLIKVRWALALCYSELDWAPCIIVEIVVDPTRRRRRSIECAGKCNFACRQLDIDAKNTVWRWSQRPCNIIENITVKQQHQEAALKLLPTAWKIRNALLLLNSHSLFIRPLFPPFIKLTNITTMFENKHKCFIYNSHNGHDVSLWILCRFLVRKFKKKFFFKLGKMNQNYCKMELDKPIKMRHLEWFQNIMKRLN